MLQSALLSRKQLREVCTHLRLIPSSAMRLLQVGKEFDNIPPVAWVGGDGHRDELMPGVIVIVEGIEETFLNVNLPCDEEFAVMQVGTDLLFDFFKWEACPVAKDCLAMLLVVAGIAVQVGKADVRIVRHDEPCLPPPNPAP